MKTQFALWVLAAGLLVSATAQAQDASTTQQSTTTTTTTTTTQNDNSATPQSDPNAAMPNGTSPNAMPDNSGNVGAMQNDANAPATGQDRGNVRTVSGCLQNGDGAKEFALTAQDGSTWELRSDAVDLASHVGQTVMVTGAVRNSDMHNMKEDAKREAQEHGMNNTSTEHGHLTVTDLNVVSRNCGVK